MPGAGASSITFLHAPLQGAVPLEQMDGVAVVVPEDLHLDMARLLDPFFDQAGIVAEARLRFALGALQRRAKVGGFLDPAHALAAAAGARFDQNRIADLFGLGFEISRVLVVAVIAGHHRDAGLDHQSFRGVLQTHRADRLRRWPDEADAGRLDRGDEIGVLRKKAVAGMNGVRARHARGFDDPVSEQIALAHRRRSEAHGFVRHLDVKGAARPHRNGRRPCRGRDASPFG